MRRSWGNLECVAWRRMKLLGDERSGLFVIGRMAVDVHSVRRRTNHGITLRPLGPRPNQSFGGDDGAEKAESDAPRVEPTFSVQTRHKTRLDTHRIRITLFCCQITSLPGEQTYNTRVRQQELRATTDVKESILVQRCY